MNEENMGMVYMYIYIRYQDHRTNFEPKKEVFLFFIVSF